MESKEVAVEIEFLLTIKPVFDEFMTKFQKEEPMIHLLYASSEKLLKTTMSRLLKEKAYMDRKGDKLKEVKVDEVTCIFLMTGSLQSKVSNMFLLVDAHATHCK